MTAFCGNVPLQIPPIKIIVLAECNPSGSRPNFFGRQHLTFDKGGKCGGAKQGIVRFWEGWWSNNPSGSRPNFFGRQHLTFNKGGKCDSALAQTVVFQNYAYAGTLNATRPQVSTYISG